MYYEKILAEREEGVIIKPSRSIYQPGFEPGTNSQLGWFKLKRDYIEGLGDTADFAIIGGVCSTRTDSKFTPGQNNVGGFITKYAVGCLLNENVVRSPIMSVRPRFGLVFYVDCGFADQETREFDLKTFDNRVKNMRNLVNILINYVRDMM